MLIDFCQNRPEIASSKWVFLSKNDRPTIRLYQTPQPLTPLLTIPARATAVSLECLGQIGLHQVYLGIEPLTLLL